MAKSVIHIAGSKNKALDKEQKRFNTSIQKIGTLRKRITHQREAAVWLNELFIEIMEQPIVRYRQTFERYVHTLYEKYLENKLTATQQEKLRLIILREVDFGLSKYDIESLEAISEALLTPEEREQIAQDEEARLSAMQELLTKMAGVPVSDRELTPEEMQELAAKARANLREKQEAAAAAAEARKAARPKTAQQLEKEAREKLLQEQLNKGIKQIYRGLAMLAHPDRATDEADATYRTALIQEINAAYNANNLLRLLELQAELLQHNASNLDTLSPETLQTYNTLLARQIKELKDEEDATHPRYNGHPYGAYYCTTRELTAEKMHMGIERMEYALENLENVIHDSKSDKWFKEYVKKQQ